jgi:hypothetical protein
MYKVYKVLMVRGGITVNPHLFWLHGQYLLNSKFSLYSVCFLGDIRFSFSPATTNRVNFSYLRHLFEYIGTQFPPPSSLLYGKMGSITLFFFKWEY